MQSQQLQTMRRQTISSTMQRKLWQVSVGSVSQRFVMASSASEAVESVKMDILRQLEVKAHLPPKELTEFVGALGPHQRRRALAAMDGLNPPSAERGSTALLRRLEHWERTMTEWTEKQVAAAPPINPLTLERLLKLVELKHQHSSIFRLRARLSQEDFEEPIP
jgi:hypothetical protein